MRVAAPLWLNSPIITWIPCTVVGELPQEGYVVEISVEGTERSIVVQSGYLREIKSKTYPTKAELQVIVLAEISDDNRMLAELPTTPLNGSQRFLGSPAALQVA